jgi:hypothetical protein
MRRGLIPVCAANLEAVYTNLTKDSDAFPKFKELLDRKFPGSSAVNNDPFPLPSAAVLSTLQYLHKDHPGTKFLRQLVDSKAGNLRALLNSDRSASLIA